MQEVFEARYVKVSQEGSPVPRSCSELGQGETVGMLSTSSDSESCSGVESSSEEVAMQLANLKERVSAPHSLCKKAFFWVLLMLCDWLVPQLKVVSHQLSRLTQIPSKKQKKNRLKREKIPKEKDLNSKHNSSKCKIIIKKVAKTKSPTL